MNHISFRRPAFYRQTARIRDITVLAEYGQEGKYPRREHAALIRQHYQYREFVAAPDISPYPSLYTRAG